MFFIQCQGSSVGEGDVSFEAFFEDSAGFGARNIGEERCNIETGNDVCIVVLERMLMKCLELLMWCCDCPMSGWRIEVRCLAVS